MEDDDLVGGVRMNFVGGYVNQGDVNDKQLRIGVVGGSGYTGAELLRLLTMHPNFEVVVVTGETQAGNSIADLYPNLRAHYADMRFVPTAEAIQDHLPGLDIVFGCLPHKASQETVAALVESQSVKHVLDLSADFRFDNAEIYEAWYETPHTKTHLFSQFAYGLPELFPKELAQAKHVAIPGCYVTAASLALAPLIRRSLISKSGIIIDAASGISGAGRKAKLSTSFCSVTENMSAYGLCSHRHTPEIERNLDGAQVLFTPHLVPMSRGIFATCYALRAEDGPELSTEILLETLSDFYSEQPFVVVSETLPETKSTMGSNSVHISARYDKRTGRAIILSALDNLVKGASGQAIQCANIVTGLAQTTGLPTAGLTP